MALIKTGHALAWNTTFQYHAWDVLCPSLKLIPPFMNTEKTTARNRPSLPRDSYWDDSKSRGRVVAAVGAGFQIAVTQFYTYNHAKVLTVRFPF